MGDTPTLATLLRDQSAETVTAFVAALYAARGAETSVDGDVVVVDGRRVLVVHAGVRGFVRARLRPTAADVDRVVTVDSSRKTALERRYDAPVDGPTALDSLARYGLDREVANALYRRLFARPLDEVALPERTRPHGTASGPTGDTRAPERGDRWSVGAGVAAVVAVVALTAVVVAGMGPAGVGSVLEPTGLSSDATTPTVGGAGAGEAGVATEPRPTADSTSGDAGLSLAPGVATDGVSDSDELAAAHASILANQSYTWELTYTESTGRNETGVATERVTVANSTVWASNVTHDGFFTTVGPIANRPSYADGQRRYEPTANGSESTALGSYDGVGRHESRAQRYVSVLVDGENTSVLRTILGDPRLYVVNVDGAGVMSVQNYTATAHVAPDGFVAYYSGSWCLTPFGRDDGRRTCVSFTMRYLDVGRTDVEPPAWYRAREACPNPPQYCGEYGAASANASTNTETTTATGTNASNDTPTDTDTATA